MPWNESTRMDERLVFVEAYLSGHFSLSELCRSAGVSRPTGYLWIERYRRHGESGLVERSHAAHSCPHRTPRVVAERLLALRQAHPFWGPRKLISYGARHWPQVPWPSRSTAAAILRQAGLVKPRRRRRHLLRPGQAARTPELPNQLWTTDFKGEFRTRDQRYCYPLTVGDLATRFLLGCKALHQTHCAPTEAAMDRVFQEYGLPDALHFDWGSPFAGTGFAGLTRLSLKWLKLGITLERSRPGCPQDNACHERMHRTLKNETTRPPAANLAAQQRRFDRFRQEFNFERPHQSLADRPPADLYRPSSRAFPRRPPEPHYPQHFEIRRLSPRGELRLNGRSRFFGSVLARETIGLEEAEDGVWRVYFGPQMLACLDEIADKLIEVPV